MPSFVLGVVRQRAVPERGAAQPARRGPGEGPCGAREDAGGTSDPLHGLLLHGAEEGRFAVHADGRLERGPALTHEVWVSKGSRR